MIRDKTKRLSILPSKPGILLALLLLIGGGLLTAADNDDWLHIYTWASSLPLGSNCDYVSIGSYTYLYPENIYIDELRISNVARWTSSFTPLNQPY